MITKDMKLDYSLLTILSTGKKSCQNMGKTINFDGRQVAKLLNSSEDNFKMLRNLAVKIFGREKEITITIDDTLIRKFYSKEMVGAGEHYDTEINRRIMAFKLLISCATNGEVLIPIQAHYLFPKELLDVPQSKDELVQSMIMEAKKLFSGKPIKAVLDGAFATVTFFEWCKKYRIAAETRMHSNRIVRYKGKKIAIRDIETLKPRGRHMARTIRVMWHGMFLFITAERRIDKHGQETIVYQASTFKAKPSEHVKAYKKRWRCEKMHRTTKQYLGLEDCYSLKMETQFAHVTSVLFAYALVQIRMQEKKFDNPEKAIEDLKRKNFKSLKAYFDRLGEIFGGTYA